MEIERAPFGARFLSASLIQPLCPSLSFTSSRARPRIAHSTIQSDSSAYHTRDISAFSRCPDDLVPASLSTATTCRQGAFSLHDSSGQPRRLQLQ